MSNTPSLFSASLRLCASALLVLALLAPSVACGQDRVRIGSKASIGNISPRQLLTHLARHAGSKAEHRAALGGTQVAYRALLKGEIDVYTEYTGTLEREIL